MNRILKLVSAILFVVLVGTTVLAQEWQDLRINSDSTNQLQNEQQVVVNPTNPANLVAAWGISGSVTARSAGVTP